MSTLQKRQREDARRQKQMEKFQRRLERKSQQETWQPVEPEAGTPPSLSDEIETGT